MSLKEQISSEIKAALKGGDRVQLECLRFVLSAFKNREIELRPNELTDEEALNVVKKLAKQRKESIDQFTAANRLDLAEKETVELKILEKYLPAQMDRGQLEKIIVDVIDELKASSIKDMGGVIKAVAAKTSGAADNKIVSEIVRSKLQ